MSGGSFIKGTTGTGRSAKRTAMLAKEFAEKRKKDLAAAMKRVKKHEKMYVLLKLKVL